MRRFLWILCLLAGCAPLSYPAPDGKIRLCAAQPATVLVDWHLKPAAALAAVDRRLGELEQVVHQAGASGCSALAFPEDTLGLLNWEVGNKADLRQVLPHAVPRMLDQLGHAAAAHRMFLILASDDWKSDGTYRNTAFLLNRDGREIGRYHKVHPTVSESDRARGETFPVFETTGMGAVGMLICYDMVMPEAPRSLALAGAGIIFVPTMGGALTTGDADLDRAAFRVRAADNYVYLVIAKRGGGSMIISPQGKVLAEGHQPGGFVSAEIDPFGGREGGDAHNAQKDMRARLFRERNPAAYRILTDPNPPVLQKIPATITVSEAVRIFAGDLTTGQERFSAADALLRAGKSTEAAHAFEALRSEFPNSWIDREAGKRLARIRTAR